MKRLILIVSMGAFLAIALNGCIVVPWGGGGYYGGGYHHGYYDR